MRKIRFMAEEFFRSFRKGFFKNLILMVLFSIGLVMAVLMGSYYLDLGEWHDDDMSLNHDEGGKWYSVSYDSMALGELDDSLKTARACWNMVDFYERLRNIEGHPLMAVDTSQMLNMKETDMKELFGNKDYMRFLDRHYPSVTAAWADGEICNQVNVKSIQLDFRAYQFHGLRTETGEGFTEANTTIRRATDPIPIVVGNQYKDVLSIGQIINICYPFDNVFPCRVTGILEAGAGIADFGVKGDPMVLLDTFVLFPFGVRIQERTAETKEIKKFAAVTAAALGDSTTIRMKGRNEFRKMSELFRNIGKEFDIPVSISPSAQSMGMELLREESAASVRIMLILTVAVIAFMFYGLFVTFYDKIQSNSRVYGIYLMNGCSLWMIMVPCLFEVAVILIPSVFVCKRLFRLKNLRIDANVEVIRRAGYCFAGFAFLAGALFLIYLLRGVDTERLLRRKD